MISFHIIVTILGAFILTFSLIFTFKEFWLNKIYKSFFLRYFFLIPLFAAFLTYFQLFTIYSKNILQLKISSLFAEQISILLNFISWSIFFVLYFKSKKFKRSFRISVALSFIGLFFSYILFEKSNVHLIVHSIYCTIFCMYCLLYFYHLFYGKPILDLKSEPVFWISMGLLFSSAISIPIYLASNFMTENNMKDAIRIMFPFTNILIIFMHCMFIKAAISSRNNMKASISST